MHIGPFGSGSLLLVLLAARSQGDALGPDLGPKTRRRREGTTRVERYPAY